jgi:hypothetical protein
VCIFQSPHFPESYHDGETCEIHLSGPGSLSSTSFDTESCCDHLTIGHTTYDGDSGPEGVIATAQTAISWRTDGSVTHGGWEVCASATGPVPPPVRQGLCDDVTQPGHSVGQAALNPCPQLVASGQIDCSDATQVQICLATCAAQGQGPAATTTTTT